MKFKDKRVVLIYFPKPKKFLFNVATTAVKFSTGELGVSLEGQGSN